MDPEQLKKHRHDLGMSQAELAHELGVDRKTVNRWEQGLHPISDTAVKLLGYLVSAKL